MSLDDPHMKHAAASKTWLHSFTDRHLLRWGVAWLLRLPSPSGTLRALPDRLEPREAREQVQRQIPMKY